MGTSVSKELASLVETACYGPAILGLPLRLLAIITMRGPSISPEAMTATALRIATGMFVLFVAYSDFAFLF